MQELLNHMKAGYLEWVSAGQYLVLFFLAMLCLYLFREQTGINKDNEHTALGRNYVYAAFVMTLLLLCPVSALLLLKYQTSYYRYSSLLLLLPVTGIIAYAATEMICQSGRYIKQQYPKQKQHIKRADYVERLVIAAVVLLFFLSGSVAPAGSVTKGTMTGTKLADSTVEILKEIPKEQLVAAPDTIIAYARQYSGSILLLYGRNMGNPALNAYTYDTYDDALISLHEWLNPDEEQIFNGECVGSSLLPAEALEIIRQYGCGVLVLTKAQYEWEPLREALRIQGVYEYHMENAEYVILLRSNGNDSK